MAIIVSFGVWATVSTPHESHLLMIQLTWQVAESNEREQAKEAVNHTLDF